MVFRPNDISFFKETLGCTLHPQRHKPIYWNKVQYYSTHSMTQKSVV